MSRVGGLYLTTELNHSVIAPTFDRRSGHKLLAAINLEVFALFGVRRQDLAGFYDSKIFRRNSKFFPR